MKARNDLKDNVLNLKNTEIKLNSCQRQVQILQEQTLKYQQQVNGAIATSETLDRELNTQKEILKQVEKTKDEYIAKLKGDLSTIEDRYQALLNENCMIGEDYRSHAQENRFRGFELEKRIDELSSGFFASQGSCGLLAAK